LSRVGDAARRTGLSVREIRRLGDVEAIELVTRQGAKWLCGDAIRFVERWAAFRRAGYAERLGFKPENLRVYVEFVRWMAREELRIVHARRRQGRARTASAMAVAGHRDRERAHRAAAPWHAAALHRRGQPARARVTRPRGLELPEPAVGAVGPAEERGVRAVLDDASGVEEEGLLRLDDGHAPSRLDHRENVDNGATAAIPRTGAKARLSGLSSFRKGSGLVDAWAGGW
jgi:hypothetical protein